MNDDEHLDLVSKQCVHFNGLQHERCKAGLDLLRVRDTSAPRPYRWPCIAFVGEPACATTCASFRAQTPEERAAAHAKERAEALAALEQSRDKLAHCQCPTCDTTIGELRQDGRCVYVEPCGHRLGQGDAQTLTSRLLGQRRVAGQP